MGIRLERAAGPLAEHRPGYQAELERLGYTRNTVKHHLVVVSQLDRYLLAEGAALGAVDEELIGRFVAARTEENLAACRSPRMLAPLLSYLRRLGVVPPAVPAVPGSPADAVVAGWRQYLLAERGMTPAAARGYTDVVRPFLAARDDGGCVRLDGLGAAEISAFMLGSAPRFAPKTMQRLASALRSFFSYAFMTGLLDTDVSGAVPGVACRSAQLPKFLTPQQVQAMISTCGPGTVAGARDRAMMLMLWRLGLRAGEVAGMRLGDIDWRAGEVTVTGKGRKDAQLPLPADVGEAVAGYLRLRPGAGPDRAVFVRLCAPYRGLTAGAVTNAVAAASQSAGLGVLHAHRLRHSAATAMLAGGASLTEIGQVLRHQNPVTTSIYARVDIEALRGLARPWTGTGAA
jgi:site-specific recombinase XerD